MPSQFWPPLDDVPGAFDEAHGEADEKPLDLSMTHDVEQIDDVIEDIRRIQSGEDAPGCELSPATPAGVLADGMLAGVVAPDCPPVVAPTPEAACRVRPQSENEIGQLWTSIFFSADHPAPKAIVVTSARRGDGATQIAAALALVGAEANSESHILLVDFNLRNPNIANLLNVQSTPGLTDVLTGREKLDRAVRALSLKNGKHLHVLPAGAHEEQPLRLLKSRPMSALLAQLSRRYDHVIIDAASANVYPDPQVIGAHVDGALLVIQAGRTPRETVADAKKRLDLAKVRCLGLVMNQRTDPIPSLLYRMT